MSNPGVSAGEVGGVLAGAVAGLVAIGKGAGWLLNFRERRAESRARKLQLWHDELERREAGLEQRQTEYWQKLEAKLAAVEVQNSALRMAFELVAAPLRAIDPRNPALAQAEQLLRAAFPLDLHSDFDGLLMQIDAVTRPS